MLAIVWLSVRLSTILSFHPPTSQLDKRSAQTEPLFIC